MGEYGAWILADSVSEAGNRLTTMEVTFPRIVLSEFNTHRMFSRNSASSRAIPIAIERVDKSPFVPDYWGMNQGGMQAETELEGDAREAAICDWLSAREEAVFWANELAKRDAHKQLVNRLLEPFAWHTVIISATEWSNFFALRANPMAQPEIRVTAEMMLEAYTSSLPKLTYEGEWHLPLIQDDERNGNFEFSEEARKVSAARCARVSYLTYDGKPDLEADLKLYERLIGSGYMSPLEHVATPFVNAEWNARDAAASVVASSGIDKMAAWQIRQNLQFNGNFRGWTQLRKLIPNEHDFGLVEKN